MVKSIHEWQSQGGNYFTFKHHRIFYKTAGEGTPLLLIHGFPTACWDWCKIWDELASHYRLITFDLIGFGLSDKPKQNQYSIFQQADIAEALLSHLSLNECHILAHDYGDTVAQELLARHNENTLAVDLQSVAYLNGGLFHGVHKPLLIQKLLMTPIGRFLGKLINKDRFTQSMRTICGKNSQPSEQELDILWQLISHKNGNAVIHKVIRYMHERKKHAKRWIGALQQTKLPMRLIDGTVDPISGQHLIDYYQEHIPNADTIELDGVGHYPQLEAPEKVLEYYLEFRQQNT